MGRAEEGLISGTFEASIRNESGGGATTFTGSFAAVQR